MPPIRNEISPYVNVFMGEYRVKSGKQREEGEAVAIFAWGLQQFGVVVWERSGKPPTAICAILGKGNYAMRS